MDPPFGFGPPPGPIGLGGQLMQGADRFKIEHPDIAYAVGNDSPFGRTITAGGQAAGVATDPVNQLAPGLSNPLGLAFQSGQNVTNPVESTGPVDFLLKKGGQAYQPWGEARKDAPRVALGFERHNTEDEMKRIQAEKAAAEGGAGSKPPSAQYIAAHWDPSRNPLRKETLAGIEKGLGEQREGVQQQGAAQVASADEVRAQYENYQRIQENQHLVELDAQKRRDDARKAQEMRISEMQDEARNARIDPQRVQKGMGAPEWIAYAAGSAASGLYESYMNTMLGQKVENKFQQSFERMVQEDIDLQKQEVAAKQQGVTDAVNTYDRMLSRFGDDMQAEAATRAYYAEQMKTELARVGAQSESDMAKANTTKAIGDVDVYANEHMGKLRDLAEFVPAYVAGGGGGTSGSAKMGNIIEWDGQRFQVDEKSRPEMVKKIEALKNLERISGEMKQLGFDRTIPFTDANADAKRLFGELQIAIKNTEDLGAITEADKGLISGIAKDPSSFGDLFGKSASDVVGDYARRKRGAMGERLKAEAVEGVQRDVTIDPKTGKPTPKYDYNLQTKTQTALPESFKAQ